MSVTRQRLIIFLAGGGLTLLLAGLFPLLTIAQDDEADEPTAAAAEAEEVIEETAAAESAATDEAGVEATAEAPADAEPTEPFYDLSAAPVIEPTGSNSYCVVCHNQPLQSVTLQDGYILNLYVSPDIIANSVHGTSSEGGPLGCVDCHGAESFPHRDATPADQRAYSIRSVQFCIGCHTDQVESLQHGLHEQAILTGNTQAAVCTDCHGAHDIQPVARFPELVAGVCGECHENTLVEWRSSAHVDIGPLDCATCHSPHSQRIRVGATTDELCMNCHTEMPEVYAHTQHVGSENSVECVECHMFLPEPDEAQLVNVSAEAAVMGTGHTMDVETVACNTCHEGLVASGEWSRIVGDVDTLRAERDALQMRISELESLEAASGEVEQPASYIQLIQGLILGIGFGITGAAVFIARGNRRN